MAVKITALTLWFTLVSIGGMTAGHQRRIEPSIPTCCAMVEDIPMQIVRAALRHGISPSRALARAWNESKYQDIDSACCRGPMQLHRKLWPQMTAQGNVEAGVKHLAMLIKRYGSAAERVYRTGHP